MTSTNDLPIRIQVNNGQISLILDNELPAGEYILKNQFMGTLTHAQSNTGTSNITIQTGQQTQGITSLNKNTIYLGSMTNTTDADIRVGNGIIHLENVLTDNDGWQKDDIVYFIPLEAGMVNWFQTNEIDDIIPIDQNISAIEGEKMRELDLITSLRYKDNVLYVMADANPEVFRIPSGVTKITNNHIGLTLNVQIS